MNLQTVEVGTAHGRATCGWCPRRLQVAEVGGLRCWVCPGCWERQVRHAIFVGAGKQQVCKYVPLPSQVPLYEAAERYVLWGGQAGPGKSTGARWWLYTRSLLTPGHEALLLRENWDQLQANHTLKMAWEVPALGGRWLEGEKRAVFGSGSSQALIHCGHMSDVESLQRYIGQEYGAIVADEASRYPVTVDGVSVLGELSTRARQRNVDREGRVVGAKWVPVTNPGGPSAAWLADMHIHKTPDVERYPALREAYRAEEWVYVPARLDDNPYLDEEYERSLAVLDKTRYEQLRHGDWTVFAGQFFSEWTPSRHVAECVMS